MVPLHASLYWQLPVQAFPLLKQAPTRICIGGLLSRGSHCQRLMVSSAQLVVRGLCQHTQDCTLMRVFQQ